MKLQGFLKYNKRMKITKLLIMCVCSIILCGCCDESTQIMKYHFFTKAELEDVYINVDSIMSFQSKISDYVRYEQFKGKQHEYSEIDTVLFLSENADTISCRYNNSIEIKDLSDGLSFGYHSATMTTIRIILFPIDSCFIFGAEFNLRKPSEIVEDSLSKQIGFWYPNYKSKGYNVYLYESGKINQDKTYSIVSRETFNFNNLQIDNCLFVRFYNDSSNEQALIVYSNKYGFLKIKDTQHEITRIL